METARSLIQDVICPKSVSLSPQAENVPPMPTLIKTPTFYQWESSSNFQTTVLSQLSLLVKLTQSMGERLTNVEKDVADLKHFMILGDDDADDMVIEDTPLNSPDDNPPPPIPPSSNLPPPPPPSSNLSPLLPQPSHLPHTSSPPSGYPP